MKWQPMNTAPKNGVWIIVREGGYICDLWSYLWPITAKICTGNITQFINDLFLFKIEDVALNH